MILSKTTRQHKILSTPVPKIDIDKVVNYLIMVSPLSKTRGEIAQALCGKFLRSSSYHPSPELQVGAILKKFHIQRSSPTSTKVAYRYRAGRIERICDQRYKSPPYKPASKSMEAQCITKAHSTQLNKPPISYKQILLDYLDSVYPCMKSRSEIINALQEELSNPPLNNKSKSQMASMRVNSALQSITKDDLRLCQTGPGIYQYKHGSRSVKMYCSITAKEAVFPPQAGPKGKKGVDPLPSKRSKQTTRTYGPDFSKRQKLVHKPTDNGRAITLLTTKPVLQVPLAPPTLRPSDQQPTTTTHRQPLDVSFENSDFLLSDLAPFL